MTLVKPAAVAGTFYNENPKALQADMQNFAQKAYDHMQETCARKALIAPHAGHRYSGYCATRAYLSLPQTQREKITRIILLGPAHHFPANGMAITRADLWQCPLGAIEIDRDAAKIALQFDAVEENDIPHMNEHCLEVHVPFFKSFFPHAKLLPFAVTNVEANSIAEILQALWGGEETLIVISTDLSHYNNYLEAQLLDHETAEWIESYNWQLIDGKHACGRVPMSGLLLLAKDKSMSIERIHMMNSGDALNDTSAQVVGYGSWALN